MNVIEVMKQVIADYPKIAEFEPTIHVDESKEEDGYYSLSSVGDSRQHEDILGNQTRINNMVLYATSQSMDDYERLNNSSFVLDLGYYLETIKGNPITAEINSQEHTGHIKEVSCANGMAWSRSEDNQYLTYMIQIKVIYTLSA